MEANEDVLVTPKIKISETLGHGPSGGDDDRLQSETPEWHISSSCCGASEMGAC